MGRTLQNPRYHVYSVRLSDEERAVLQAAKAAGLTPEDARNLLVFAARLFSTNTQSPLMRIILQGRGA